MSDETIADLFYSTLACAIVSTMAAILIILFT